MAPIATRLYYGQHLLVAYRVVPLGIRHGTQPKGDWVLVTVLDPSSLLSRGSRGNGVLRNDACYSKSGGVRLQADRPLVVEMRKYWSLSELALEAPKGLLHFRSRLE